MLWFICMSCSIYEALLLHLDIQTLSCSAYWEALFDHPKRETLCYISHLCWFGHKTVWGFFGDFACNWCRTGQVTSEVLKKLPILNKLFSLNIKICITYIQRFKQIAMLCYIATHHTTLRLDHVLTCNTELSSSSILSMSSVM